MIVGVPADRITVIPHGPGLVEEGVPRQLRPDAAVWEIGYVSKFGVQKNFDVVLRAVASLRRRHPVRLTLTLNEREPWYATVAASIAELGLTDVVRNLGELDRGRMQSVYDELDVFVFPSLCESFGFPLVEAMARGLPVVAADIPSTREIGGSALDYFEPHDEAALAEAIVRVMNDPACYARQSERALVRSRNYSWSRSAEMNLDVIDQLVGKATQRGTAAHYESHPFDFMTESDAAQVESLQPPPVPAVRRAVSARRRCRCGCGLRTGTGDFVPAGQRLRGDGRGPDATGIVADARTRPGGGIRAGQQPRSAVRPGFLRRRWSRTASFTTRPIRRRSSRTSACCAGAVTSTSGFTIATVTTTTSTRTSGVPIRWLENRPWGRRLVHATLLPVYYLVHLVKSRGKRTWRGARHFFYDYIITPRASFHTGGDRGVGASRRVSSCSNTIPTWATSTPSFSARPDMKICIVSSCGGHLTEVRALRPRTRSTSTSTC